jgi:hypothetical protein
MQQRGTMCAKLSSEFKRNHALLPSMLRRRRRCYGSLPLAVRSRPGRLSRKSQVETRRRESRVETLEKSTDSGKARPHLPELPLSHSSAPLISTALFSLRPISHQHHQSRHSHRYHHHEGSRTIGSIRGRSEGRAIPQDPRRRGCHLTSASRRVVR